MQKRFAQKIEEMRRLIDGSAFVSVGGEGSHGSRKNPSHFVAARCKSPQGCLLTALDPCGQGGSTLSATVASLSAPQCLLAVSGGMDSMCMADLFLQTLGADSFAIAHCNFSLRGEESDSDEALVREWAERNDVHLFVKRFDTEAYARENGISIEMAARDLRYGWFAQLCQEHGFASLSVAHNADDNAETLMLNLLRGTGLKGLHGMSEISSLSVRTYNKNVTLYRPLLEFTRKQIEGYVLTHRVPYRHDSSNFTSDYKRNRIRNEVFPIFKKINPSFIRTLNREMGYFSEAEQIVSDWCEARLPEVLLCNEPVTIGTSALLATPHWRYLLYHILEPYGFSSQTLASIEDLLTSDRTVSGKRFESPTHILLTGRKAFTVLPLGESYSIELEESRSAVSELCSCSASHSGTAVPQGGNGEHCLSDDIMVVRGPGTYNFNGARFSVELLPWSREIPLKQPQGVLIMDADKMKFPFVCRRWRQGDWLVPFGMKGKKKVSDLFADLKYDTFEKESAIMLVDTQTEGLSEQQHIAGLLGVRIDDRYKVTSVTKTIIRMECK